MSEVLRQYRPVITGVSAVLAVGTVLAAAGGYIPSRWLPRPPEIVLAAIPHLNVLIALAAIGTIVHGWRSIRRNRVERHRVAMLTASFLFATFLTLYLYRLVVLGGPTPFSGPEAVYRLVYMPILTVHIAFAVICIPLVFDALGLGLTVPSHRLPETRHPTVGRIAAILWVVSFALGIVVYVLIHWV